MLPHRVLGVLYLEACHRSDCVYRMQTAIDMARFEQRARLNSQIRTPCRLQFTAHCREHPKC